jgi:hypothetical protein
MGDRPWSHAVVLFFSAAVVIDREALDEGMTAVSD